MRFRNILFACSLLAVVIGPAMAGDVWQSVKAGSNPRGLAVGDVEGNGTSDLVVANFGAPSFIGQDMPVSMMGTLQLFSFSGSDLELKAEVTAGVGPRSVAVLPGGSIVTSLYGENLVKTFRYKSGRLIQTQSVATLARPVGLAVGDGVVAVASYGDSKVSIFPIDGEDTLGARTDVATSPGTTAVAVGKLFGHRLPEVAVACLASDRVLVLASSSGIGSYSIVKTLNLPQGSGPADLRLEDVDGDGRMDLVAVLFSGKSIAVFRQDASGDFGEPVITKLTGVSPNGLTVLKQGSGTPLVAVAERDSDLVELFAWDSGLLALKASFAVDPTPAGMGPVEVAFLRARSGGKTMLAVSHMRSGTIRLVGSDQMAHVASAEVAVTPTQTTTPVVSPTETPSPRNTATPETSEALPLSDQTTLAYPNPYRGNGVLTIQFTLDETASVDVRIFDLMGRPVWSSVLPAGSAQMGLNRLTWDGHSSSKVPLATGVYVCHIVSGKHVASKKVFIVR